MSLLGNTAELAILLKLKDEFSGPLKNADNQLQGLHSRAGQVAGGLGTMGKGLAVAAERIAAIGITAGVAIGGIAVNATKAASSFQAAMELIHTQAGATTQEVTDLSKAVLALAPQVGTGPDELAAGLYHIESAGLRGAKALEILKIAAEGAKVGNADLESVTNALIASVNSGIKGTTDMTQAMGVLNAIVGSGNMRMQDLTGAFTTGILSSAKAFGISIQSVGAALADMTNQGVPAIDAATRLRMTISLLGAPTSKAAKELKSIGIGQFDLATAMRGPDGILGAVALLKEHLDASGLAATQQTALLSAAFGGGRSSSAILTLLGSLKQFGVIQDQVNTSTGKFGEAWAATQQDVDQKVANVRASLDTLRITLGERLLPVAGSILDEMSKVLASPAVTAGVDQFGQAIAGLFTPDNITRAEQFVGQVAYFAKSIIPPLISGMQIAGQVVAQAISAFTSLPGPLQALIIGGLAVNKLSGGLVATGLKQVAQGMLGGGGGVGGGGGIVGGMLGVQKVFVVNMGAGGMGGGGVGDAAKGLGVGGVLAAGAAVAAVGAVGAVAIDQYNQIGQQATDIATRTQEFVKTATLDQLKSAQQAVIDGAKQVVDQAGYNPLASAANEGLNAAYKTLTDAIYAKLHAAGVSSGGTGGMVGQDLYPSQTGGLHAVNQLSGGLSSQLAGGRAGQSAAGLAMSITDIFAKSTAPSLRSMDSALGQLRTLQARYLAQGDTKLAASVGADIKYLSGRVDAVTQAINLKQFIATGILGSPSLTGAPHASPQINAATGFTVNVQTSARQNVQATVIQGRYGPTSAGGQAVRAVAT